MLIEALAATTLLPFVLTYILTLLLIKLLKTKNILVVDYHKKGRPKVPYPGGPAIFISISLAELIIYIQTSNLSALAVMISTLIAGLIGLIDDFYKLSGAVKPSLLLFASLPIILLKTYDYHLQFPLFGSVRLSIIYPILILLAIPITANTVNTIDVLNGVVSGFIIIASFPLFIATLMSKNYQATLISLPLILSSLAFFLFHRYPSKIFPGDSGTLAMGACYGALAIISRAEFVGVVALLPAILNSFFFLTSVKKFIEHRMIKERPTWLDNEFRINASKSKEAPITLVRMIVSSKPMYEKEVVNEIYKLTFFSSILAVITAFLIYGVKVG